jgi:hypothetical protein
MSRAFRFALALLPLALTPALLSLLAEGHLSLGAGEKDLVVLFPWILWSFLFAVSSLVSWRRGRPVGPSTVRAAGVGLAGVVLGAAILAAFGQLGVGGVL